MQCLGDDQCRPRIACHAVACNAWVMINIALALAHAVACKAWATIDVALVLLVVLVHEMLGRRWLSPLHC